MKMTISTIVCALLAGAAAFAQDASARGAPKILIAFFSKTNNTRTIAEMIQARVGGDLFQVATAKPYPPDYRETTAVARIELDNNQRPELAATVPVADMASYDVVFLGYPCWWGTMPMAMFTFLEQYDLSGKTIVPFCTHGGSGLARSPADIAALAPGAVLGQGLAVRGDSASRAQGDVDNWLRRLGFVR